MEERHLSLGEVAELMEVTDRTVRRWIKSGKLKAYKPGRDYRIPESAVREFVEESEAYPKAEASPSSEPSFNDVLEEERREDEEALGRALAHHVHTIREHAEEILQRRFDEAVSEEDRERAVNAFQRSYVHAFVLVAEPCNRFPAVLVDELRAATDAWRERLLEFYSPPERSISVDELPVLEARKLEKSQ